MSAAPSSGLAIDVSRPSATEKLTGSGTIALVCSAPVAASVTLVPMYLAAVPTDAACWA